MLAFWRPFGKILGWVSSAANASTPLHSNFPFELWNHLLSFLFFPSVRIWLIHTNLTLCISVFPVFTFLSLYLFHAILNFPTDPPWQSPPPPIPDHSHTLIIKPPLAPPHLWGNLLAGHLCLSDKEQRICFIPASLFVSPHFLTTIIQCCLAPKNTARPMWIQERQLFYTQPLWHLMSPNLIR